MKKENILRLLIVDDSSNDAEAVTNVLRRAGYGVRAQRAATKDEVEAALTEHVFDIVLCAVHLTHINALQTLDLVKATGKDISFILLANSSAESIPIDAFQAGARDLVLKDQPKRLQLIIARELTDLETRRQYRLTLNAYRESEKRCRSLIDSSRDAIAYVHDGMHIYANSVYLNMFGYHSKDEIEGTPIMDMVAPSGHALFKDFLRNYDKAGDKTNTIDVCGVRTDHSEFKARMDFSPASIDGEACTQIIIRDLSENQEWENKLKSLTKQDLLTGLYNRQHFLEELEAALSKASSGAGNSMLLYIELDNFKDVKEKVGIAASDLALSDIAGVLRTHAQEAGLLARFGDDVFTLLLVEKDMEHARGLAHTLVKVVEENIYDAAGHSVTVTCRISIGLINEHTLSSKELLSGVSKTHAHQESADKVAVYSPDVASLSDKQKLQDGIRRVQSALDTNRFRLVYQPIVSLHGQHSENYQVLLRMVDETGKEIEPQKFLPLVEQVGLTGTIDRWVIKHTVDVLAAKRRAGGKLTFFIKIFGETLKDPALLAWISETIKKARLEGDSLVFEVNEAAAFLYLKDSQNFAQGIKELRCRFLLDHFGCDPNSLNYLKRMASWVNYVKIDGSFLSDLLTNTQHQKAVKALNEAAHALGITTVAECVQDAGTLALLWQFGVNCVQGYYLQKPSDVLNYDFSA